MDSELCIHNTYKSTRTKTDEESIISGWREGNFIQNTLESIDNSYEFQVADNPLMMYRIYETNWVCDYQMNWYPFDTQKGQMTFSLTKYLNKFIKIAVNGHAYLGPVELTQYFVRGTDMWLYVIWYMVPSSWILLDILPISLK